MLARRSITVLTTAAALSATAAAFTPAQAAVPPTGGTVGGFASGELHSRFRFVASGVTAEVEVTTFCSRSQPTLVLQEIRLSVNEACDLRLRAMIDSYYKKRGLDPEGRPAQPIVDDLRLA